MRTNDHHEVHRRENSERGQRFWNGVLCHDSLNDAQEYLNRCKLLGPGSHSNDVIFRCTLDVEAVAQ
jgi:hypothetical protein